MIISIAAPYLDGEYVEADSVVLSSPDGSYGVRRVDVPEVVVADGTAMTYNGSDAYEYEFTGVEDASYQAWIEMVFDGETYRYEQLFDVDSLPDTVTLSFAAVKGGELVETDSLPKLSSPAGTYGAKRLSDNTTVVSADTNMALVGDALYARTFETTQGSDDESYKFYVKCAIDGVDYTIPSTTKKVRSAMLAVGRYTDSTKVSARFGVDNLHLWLCAVGDDQEEPVDYAVRAWQFIDEAEKEIDRRVNGYFVDTEYGLNNAVVPSVIVDIATKLAGIKMYEWRGVDDVDPDTNQRQHRLRAEQRDVDKTIKKIAMGEIKEARLLSPSRAPVSGGSDVTYVNDGS